VSRTYPVENAARAARVKNIFPCRVIPHHPWTIKAPAALYGKPGGGTIDFFATATLDNGGVELLVLLAPGKIV
jgi:hypothetical protein